MLVPSKVWLIIWDQDHRFGILVTFLVSQSIKFSVSNLNQHILMRISKFLFDRVLHEGLDIKVLKPEKVTPPPHKRKKPLCFGFLFVFDVASSTNQRIRGFRRGFLQAQALNDGVQQEELPRRWTGRLVDTLRVQSFQVGVEEVESLMSLEVWCEDVMYKQLDKESSTPSMMRGIYENKS